MPQDERPRQYAAFVSYRHAEVDSAVAREVQRGLERFHVPRSARAASGIDKISPVFRDKEELPVTAALGDDISQALKTAKSLVVICSPRTSESMWVEREISTFLQTHDRSRVFTVLAEGEPVDVIPRQLLFDGEGNDARPLEPLSCDFRSPKRSQRRVELVRLAAAILGVSFDSLMQRTRRRQTRIAAIIAGLAFVAVTGVAAFALWSNARIQENYEQAIENHAKTIVTQAQQELQSGDRLSAIELVEAVLPAPQDNRPVMPSLVQTLSKATHAYEHDDSAETADFMRLVAKFPLENTLHDMSFSKDGTYLAAADCKGTLHVWDAQTAEQLFQTQLSGSYLLSYSVVTDEGMLITIDSSENACVSCWDVRMNERTWTHETKNPLGRGYSLLLSDDESFVVCVGSEGACKIDVATGAIKGQVSYKLDQAKDSNQDVRAASLCSTGASKNLCAVAIESHDDGIQGGFQICIADFEQRSTRMLSSTYDDDKIWSLTWGEGDTLYASFSREYDTASDEGYLNSDHIRAKHQKYTRRVVCIDTHQDKEVWNHDVELWAPPESDSLLVIPGVDEPHIAGESPRDVLAYCVSDVCSIWDAKTGEALARYEAYAPFLAAWPHTTDGKVDGLRGCLVGGRSVAVYFSEDKCVSYDDACIDACLAQRMGNRTVLASLDNTFYCYADELEDDSFVKLIDGDHFQHPKTSYFDVASFPTRSGTVFLERYTSTEDDANVKNSLTLRMFDCEQGKIAWEHTVATDGYTLDVLGYSEEKQEVYVRAVTKDYTCTMTTLDLTSGKANEWHTATRFDEVTATTPYITASMAGQNAGNTVADLHQTAGQTEAIVTSLSNRSSKTISLEALEAQVGSLSSSYGDVYTNADGSALLVPLPREENDRDSATTRYALYCPESKSCILMQIGLPTAFPLVWSDDGSQLAVANEETLIAYKKDGTELLRTSLEGREILGMHFVGDQLLAVCNEEAHTTLLSYALDKSGDVHTATIDTITHPTSTTTDAMRRVTWVPVAENRKSPRNPGDICITIPLSRVCYVIDLATLEPCQIVRGCIGYDEHADCFVKHPSPSRPSSVGLFRRYTTDELVERGRTQVGNSRMTEAQRSKYGLS